MSREFTVNVLSKFWPYIMRLIYRETPLEYIGALAAQECWLIYFDMLGNPYNKQLYDPMTDF